MRKSEWLVGVVFLAVMAGLPFVGHWGRSNRAATCAYNGTAIEPLYSVRIVDCCGKDHEFCCITCAKNWLRGARGEPQAIFVHDETSGEEIKAADAVFMETSVVTNSTTGNNIHAFRSRSDAEKHQRYPSDEILEGAKRPFAEQACAGCDCCCPQK